MATPAYPFTVKLAINDVIVIRTHLDMNRMAKAMTYDNPSPITYILQMMHHGRVYSYQMEPKTMGKYIEILPLRFTDTYVSVVRASIQK